MDSDTLNLGDVRTAVVTAARHWWVFAICIAVPVAAVLLLGTRELDRYRSEVRILVGSARSPAAPSATEIQASRTLAQYYQDLMLTSSVLGRVVDGMDLPYSTGSLRGHITVSAVRSLLIIEVTDASPDNAAAIANSLADAFVADTYDRQLSELASLQSSLEEYGLANDAELMSAKIGDLSALSVIEPALPSSSPIPRSSKQKAVFAALAGVVLGGASVLVLRHWRDGVGTPDRLQSECGITPLASIPKFARPMELSDVVNEGVDTRTGYWESYRFLRASFQFAAGTEKGKKAFLVTSPTPGDGKTTTCLNLALAMSQEGQRTLLVDADLRKPSLHEVFGFPNEIGLTSFLHGGVDLEEIIRLADRPGAPDVITSGPVPADASPLLASPRLVEFTTRVKEQYDIVVFDSSPLLSVVDPSLLSAKLDGTLLVVDTSAQARVVRSAIALLRQAGGPVVGAALNRVATKADGYPYSYAEQYPYGDGHSSDDANRRRLGNLGRFFSPIRTLAGWLQRRRGR